MASGGPLARTLLVACPFLCVQAISGQRLAYHNERPIQELNGAPGGVYSATLTYDERYMVFTKLRALWETRRANRDSKWGTPTNLSQLGAVALYPSLSSDGLELFFCANTIKNQIGAHDLMVSTRTSLTAAWGAPSNLGVPVNGPAISNGVSSVTQDGLTLFFESNRLGNWQIFTATRTARGKPWGGVSRFGPTAGSSEDAAPMTDANGRELWFFRYQRVPRIASMMYVYLDDATQKWTAPKPFVDLSGFGTGWKRGITGRIYYDRWIGPGQGGLYIADPIAPTSRPENSIDGYTVVACQNCDVPMWWARRYTWPLGNRISLPIFYSRASKSPITSLLLLSPTSLAQPATIPVARNQLVVSPLGLAVVPFAFSGNLGELRFTVPRLAQLKGATLWFQHLWLDSSPAPLAAFSEPGRAVLR